MKSLNFGRLLKGIRALSAGKPRPLKEVRVHTAVPRKCEKCKGNENFPFYRAERELPPFRATAFLTLGTVPLL